VVQTTLSDLFNVDMKILLMWCTMRWLSWSRVHAAKHEHEQVTHHLHSILTTSFSSVCQTLEKLSVDRIYHSASKLELATRATHVQDQLQTIMNQRQ